jgi:hypothetical protein
MDRHRFATGTRDRERNHRDVFLIGGDVKDLSLIDVNGLIVGVLEANRRGCAPSSL